MALYVNTNVSSLNAQRKLTNATNNLNVSYQRLSSGLRINSSKDDAAGLQISDNMLQRIRTLAVQAATGTNTEKDRKALQEEVTALCEEITRISDKTTFAGQKVLNGKHAVDGEGLLREVVLDEGANKMTRAQLFFQVGANAYDELTLNLQGFAMSQILEECSLTIGFNGQKYDRLANADGTLLSSGDITDDASVLECGLIYDANNDDRLRWSVSTADNAQATLNNIDKFIQYVDSNRAALGAIQNRMESTIRNQSSISENESDARSRIRDTDFASETAALTQNNIIQQASQTVLAQANQRPTIALNLLGQ